MTSRCPQATRAHPPPAPLRVAVLTASYAESDCELKGAESIYENEPPPGLFFAPRWPPAKYPELLPDPNPAPFEFEVLLIHKRTAYKQVREAVKSGKYDCFFNLCDGAKDEARAGVEVLQALEEFGAPYTGAASRYFEPSKDDMKRVAHYNNIRVARGCVLDDASIDALRAKCARLTFPVIVKHVSGYSSIGMTKDAKCMNIDHLVTFASKFIARFGSALVEEFVEGDEVTVLTCADPTAPEGIRVYPPVQMNMPQGEDFKHFDLKWTSCDEMGWFPMDPADPAYEQVVRMGRDAFKHIQGGIGYGRSDIRINRRTNEAVFLEINPNCGIFYPYGSEGSSDWVLRYAGANGQGHRDFVKLQVETAMTLRGQTGPWPANIECLLDDTTDAFVLQTTRNVSEGAEVLVNTVANKLHIDDRGPNAGDEDDSVIGWPGSPLSQGRPFALAWGSDDRWGGIPHSCQPTLRFVGGRKRIAVAARNLHAGERLTLDYREAYAAMPRATGLMVPTACAAPPHVVHAENCGGVGNTDNKATAESRLDLTKASALADESASSGRTSPLQSTSAPAELAA